MRYQVLDTTVTITGVGLTALVPASGDHSVNLVQIAFHELNGGTSDVNLYVGSTFKDDLTVGPSGKVVWDTPAPVQLAKGSGYFASLDAAGSVRVFTRYFYRDERCPAFYVNAYQPNVPKGYHLPNIRGDQ